MPFILFMVAFTSKVPPAGTGEAEKSPSPQRPVGVFPLGAPSAGSVSAFPALAGQEARDGPGFLLPVKKSESQKRRISRKDAMTQRLEQYAGRNRKSQQVVRR